MTDREILFKAKRTDNGEWVDGFVVKMPNTPTTKILVWSKTIPEGRKQEFAVYDVDPTTVCQYTGKTVKTGKIFDGDFGVSLDGLFIICWDKEKAAFMMQFLDYPRERLYIEEMLDDAEIIGNLWDNPELLAAPQGKEKDEEDTNII